MYELSVEREFSAAHRMRDYQGPCARVHGHNYGVVLTVEAPELDECGIAIDFTELKRVFDAILARFDHRLLNEVPPFDDINPSSENLARIIFEDAAEELEDRVSVLSVTVSESPTSSVTYREG